MVSGKITVIGVGNSLLGDEGIGIYVINELRRLKLPSNVDIYDGGTDALSLLYSLNDYDKVIMVDAVKCGGRPGNVYHFKLSDVKVEDSMGRSLSLHDLNLGTVLSILRASSSLPNNITLIGVEPKEICTSLDLSREVKEAIPYVLNLILKEVENCKGDRGEHVV